MEYRTAEEDQPYFFKHCAETVRKYPFIALRFGGEDFWDVMSKAFSGDATCPELAPGDEARVKHRAEDLAETFEMYACVLRAVPDLKSRWKDPGYWDLLEIGRELVDGSAADEIGTGLVGLYAVYCDLEDWAQDADWTEDEHGRAVPAEPLHEEDDEDEPDDEA